MCYNPLVMSYIKDHLAPMSDTPSGRLSASRPFFARVAIGRGDPFCAIVNNL